MRSSSDSERYLKHEMGCDRLAASFVDKEALVETIHVAESPRGASRRRIASVWKHVGTRPYTKLRVDAILNHKGAA